MSRHRAGVFLTALAVVFAVLTIANALPSPPVAFLDADDLTPFVGEPVRFDASASYGHDEGNGRIAAYRFDFGDGTSTDWQEPPIADHAFFRAGVWTASVAVRDRRGFVSGAALQVEVRAVPPPTGDAPDLEPIAANSFPASPRVDDVMTIAVTILNRGGAAADAARIVITDRRPSGLDASLGAIDLAEPLGPGANRILFSQPFLAVENGTHEIRILVRDVSPAETIIDNNGRDLFVEILPASPPDDGVTPRGDMDLRTIGLAFATILAAAVAAFLLNRPKERGPREPPPPTPPGREPPPPWPP